MTAKRVNVFTRLTALRARQVGLTLVTGFALLAPNLSKTRAPNGPLTTRGASADSFPHARHSSVACLECHELGSGHGRLKFERPSGCASCHHKESNQARCTTCHEEQQYASPKRVTVTVAVAGHAAKSRPVEFPHARHTSKACIECHTTPVTLAPAPTKAGCTDCHTDHHAAGRTCSVCHTLADPKVEHKTAEIAHQNCDACHTATTVARLVPTRSLCSTCHANKARNHYDQKECTVCHFLADPATYKARLTASSPK